MEMIYSKELGPTALPEARRVASNSSSATDALAPYHHLQGTGKARLLLESSQRNIRYLIQCIGH